MESKQGLSLHELNIQRCWCALVLHEQGRGTPPSLHIASIPVPRVLEAVVHLSLALSLNSTYIAYSMNAEIKVGEALLVIVKRIWFVLCAGFYFGQESASDALELELQEVERHLPWVLGTELWSPMRVWMLNC